jgi:hypothetical protein
MSLEKPEANTEAQEKEIKPNRVRAVWIDGRGN